MRWGFTQGPRLPFRPEHVAEHLPFAARCAHTPRRLPECTARRGRSRLVPSCSLAGTATQRAGGQSPERRQDLRGEVASKARRRRGRASHPQETACRPPPRAGGLPRKYNNIYDQQAMRKCFPSTRSTPVLLQLLSPLVRFPRGLHTCVRALHN